MIGTRGVKEGFSEAPMSIASRTSGPGRPGDAAPGFVIRRVDGAALERAAGRLVHQAGGPAPHAGRAFLEMARKHGIDVSNLWASEDRQDGAIRQVCLATAGAGKTLNFFVSMPGSEADSSELGQVIEEAIRGAERTGTAIAQALLDPIESASKRAFELAGFRHVATLSYLQGRIPAPGRARAGHALNLPVDVTLERWEASKEGEFCAALDRSYIDTLDCPELCDLRATRDVLASHLATGEHDPNLWWLIKQGGRPEGALLLNPCPAQSQIELVYLGLGPGLRGRGLGRELLRFGISEAAVRRPERLIVCAVDHRNEPALRLYESLGFQAFADRVALVRPV